jgi:hypothetical protein
MKAIPPARAVTMAVRGEKAALRQSLAYRTQKCAMATESPSATATVLAMWEPA